MKLVCLTAMVIGSLTNLMAQAQTPSPNPWQQPATALAEQVAAILGAGQAHLTINNRSTLPTDQIPSIRRQLVEGLKSHGVIASGPESANMIRVTLSENARERLWVAEVIEGDETRVTMVRLDAGKAQQPQSAGGLTLRRQAVLATGVQVLAALDTPNGLVIVEPEEIVIFVQTPDGWYEQKRVGIDQTHALTRDPRAIIHTSQDAIGFEAFIAGTTCNGKLQGTADWTIHCHESDDPWPIAQSDPNNGATYVKAFYNAARNYFTGVITPSPAMDLPPFYSAVPFPRVNRTGLLIGGIDGKVELLDAVSLKSITGARDWGSDFAALHSGCGSGTQIVASGSGEASNDSLRAYELPAQEAAPFSAPLAMDGAVTALASSPDGKSLIAIMRTATNQYEVDRVTASCN
ncbi:MAG: hypothetical protein ABSF28_02570 [Terracidiphilus sp.]|jgi:hypothetical protein